MKIRQDKKVPLSDNPSGKYCPVCREQGMSHCAEVEICGQMIPMRKRKEEKKFYRIPEKALENFEDSMVESCSGTYNDRGKISKIQSAIITFIGEIKRQKP